MIPVEEWRAVAGTNGDYEVSSHGRVRSWVARNLPLPHVMAAQQVGRVGEYIGVRLYPTNQPSRMRLVHQLVIEAFVGPRPPGAQVRHLDGDGTNNRVSNLAYGTPSENIRDQVQHGTHHQAAKTHCPQGHPYDEGNTHRLPSGGRICLTCRRACEARYRARRAAARAA